MSSMISTGLRSTAGSQAWASSAEPTAATSSTSARLFCRASATTLPNAPARVRAGLPISPVAGTPCAVGTVRVGGGHVREGGG